MTAQTNLMGTKYLHVFTHFPPDLQYGGVVQSGSKLYSFLEKLGNFRLTTVSKNPAAVLKNIRVGCKCYKSFIFHRFGFSLGAIFGLWRDVQAADVVYINGIVTFPLTLAQIYSVLLNKPFAVATHGLTEWSYAYKKWRKFLYFTLIAFPLMRRAAFIRVTSNSEAEFLQARGFSNSVLVSNGISINEFNNLPVRHRGGSSFVFLFLGRMGKEKGLDILIPAYQKLRAEFPVKTHWLKLVGPDLQGYLAGMKLDYVRENIEYIPGIYGADKITLLRQADAVILPSYSENFGNVVAEAFACETPVITTTGTPWAEIEKVGCGLYIKPETEALYQAMRTMYLKSYIERQAMGGRGREYVFKNFNWEDKAKQLFFCLEKIPFK